MGGARALVGANGRDGYAFHLHDRTFAIDEVLRDHFGHAFELFARETVFGKAVEREVLQFVGAFSDLVAGEVGLELLEHVLGHRALLQAARQVPRLAQARQLHAVDDVGVGLRLLVSR